jgi:hypothetical protein
VSAATKSRARGGAQVEGTRTSASSRPLDTIFSDTSLICGWNVSCGSKSGGSWQARAPRAARRGSVARVINNQSNPWWCWRTTGRLGGNSPSHQAPRNLRSVCRWADSFSGRRATLNQPQQRWLRTATAAGWVAILNSGRAHLVRASWLLCTEANGLCVESLPHRLTRVVLLVRWVVPNGWVDGWMDGWKEGRNDGWVDGWMEGVGGRLEGCMHAALPSTNNNLDEEEGRRQR